MREAIGGTWLLGLVLTFIVFFVSFLAVSVNYSKAFNVKNNVVDMIGKYEGDNCDSREAIGNYLRNTGYLVYGYCPDDNPDDPTAPKYTGYSIDGKKVTKGSLALYCIKENSIKRTTDYAASPAMDKSYYSVVVFFKIDLPLAGNLTSFRIKGETEFVYYPKNEDERCVG